VDEAALLAALESGTWLRPGSNVFEAEPPADPRLVKHERVIATPHIAAPPKKRKTWWARASPSNCEIIWATGAVKNAVNMPSVSPKSIKKLEPYIQLGEKLGTFVAQTYRPSRFRKSPSAMMAASRT